MVRTSISAPDSRKTEACYEDFLRLVLSEPLLSKFISTNELGYRSPVGRCSCIATAVDIKRRTAPANIQSCTCGYLMSTLRIVSSKVRIKVSYKSWL